MVKSNLTDVDATTAIALDFKQGHANLSCSIMTAASPGPQVTITLQHAVIHIPAPIYCPRSFSVQYLGEDGQVKDEETRDYNFTGTGLYFEADEVARCVSRGAIESDLWGWDKSLLEMEVFDEVSATVPLFLPNPPCEPTQARKQGGYNFPEGLEKVV